jgi:hypothetical protein
MGLYQVLCAASTPAEHGFYGIGFRHEQLFRGWDNFGFRLGSRNEWGLKQLLEKGCASAAQISMALVLARKHYGTKVVERELQSNTIDTKTRFALFFKPVPYT